MSWDQRRKSSTSIEAQLRDMGWEENVDAAFFWHHKPSGASFYRTYSGYIYNNHATGDRFCHKVKSTVFNYIKDLAAPQPTTGTPPDTLRLNAVSDKSRGVTAPLPSSLGA